MRKKISFMSVLALMVSCFDNNESENLNKVERQFYVGKFSEVIPYDFEVDWKSGSEPYYSEELGFSYREYPIILKENSGPIIGNFQIRFTLLATQTDMYGFEFYVVKFYYEIKNSKAIGPKIIFSNADNFSGVAHVLDNNHELVFAKKFENGVVVEQHLFAEENSRESTNGKIDECFTVATYHYTDWYVNGGYVDSWLDDITYETYCTSYAYEPLYTPGGGGAGNYVSSTGGDAYESCSDPVHKCKFPLLDGNMPNVGDPDPALRITDRQEYLDCFDLTQSASLTIYSDQPVSGYSAAYSSTGAVGHSWVSITQTVNGITVTRSFGYYPDGTATPLAPSEPAVLVNDAGHPFDVSVTISITPQELAQIINYSINQMPSTYNLNDMNCTNFVVNGCGAAGISLPQNMGSWPPNGSGLNPGRFGQDMRNFDISNKTETRDLDGGFAPVNSGCL